MPEVDVKDDKGASQDPPAQEPSPEPEGEQDSRGPDGWIPKVRLNEVIDERNDLRVRLEQEREERIRLEERDKARKAVDDEQRHKAPTITELDEMVSRGEITQTAADVHKHRMTEDNSVAKALSIMEQRDAERRRAERRDGELTAYAKAAPDVMKKGSETWQQANDAYRDLVFYQGPPQTKEQERNYELIAVRTVLGPLSALDARKAAEAAQRANRETYNEVGNGEQTKTEPVDQKLKTLSPRQQEYYHRMSKAGRYPGGVKEYMDELAYVRPTV